MYDIVKRRFLELLLLLIIIPMRYSIIILYGIANQPTIGLDLYGISLMKNANVSGNPFFPHLSLSRMLCTPFM